jgi:hypothetical protein
MKNAEINVALREDYIGNDGNHHRPPSDYYKSANHGRPSYAVFMDKRQTHADAYQEKKDDDSGERKPKGILYNIESGKTEPTQIVGHMKYNHEHDRKAS